MFFIRSMFATKRHLQLILKFHCFMKIYFKAAINVKIGVIYIWRRVLIDTFRFNVHRSVHCKNILIYTQQDAKLHSSFYLETALHVLGGNYTHHQERKQ
jgi:hypothetical protein